MMEFRVIQGGLEVRVSPKNSRVMENDGILVIQRGLEVRVIPKNSEVMENDGI